MTQLARRLMISIGGVAAGLAIVVGGLVYLAQSDWLRDQVRKRIVAEAESATGGRIEIGSFRFDWHSLTAELDHFVIHGTEPTSGPPLLSIDRVLVGLRIISLLQRQFDIERISADTPRAHLIVQLDGATNLPQPKRRRSGNNLPETILDLKIGAFDLSKGLVLVEHPGLDTPGHTVWATPWKARGENLTAHVDFHPAVNPADSRYDGRISIAPAHLEWDFVPFDAAITADASMEQNRLTVRSASVKTAESEIDLDHLLVSSFTAPVTTAEYSIRISATEVGRILKIARPKGYKLAGTLNASGRLRYQSPRDYEVTGHLAGAGIDYGRLQRIRLSGEFSAHPDEIDLTGARVNWLDGEIRGGAHLRNLDRFRIEGTLAHFDARSLIAVADPRHLPYDGNISGDFRVEGRLTDRRNYALVATTHVAISPSGAGIPARAEIGATYDAVKGTLAMSPSWLELPQTRIDWSGTLDQRVEVRAQSDDISDLQPIVNLLIPGGQTPPIELANGSASFNGSVSGPVQYPHIAGHAAARNVLVGGQKLDSVAGDFAVSNTAVSVANTAVTIGKLNAHVTGSLSLFDWKPIPSSALTANLQLANADVGSLLALAGRRSVPLTGTLNTTAQIGGTLGDPHTTADLTLRRGVAWGEPFDSITGHAQYGAQSTEALSASVVSGAKRASVTARFEHAPGPALAGKLTFDVSSNQFGLNQVAAIRTREPDLRGNVQVKATGAVTLSRGLNNGFRFTVNTLNGTVDALAVREGARNLGDAHIVADTKNDVLTARIDSGVAGASIRGEGTIRLTDDYPVEGKVSLSGVSLGAVAALVQAPGAQPTIEGSMTGEVTVSGPAKSPELLSATLDIPQFELRSADPAAERLKAMVLHSSGPIRLSLAKQVLRVESARFVAPSTDLSLGGTIALKNQGELKLALHGNVNLNLLQTMNPDLMSSGDMVVNASVQGNLRNPDFSGRAELQKGDFHYADFSNGVTNAKGLILFSGSRANLQSLTAETGGGKLDASGYVAVTNGLFSFLLDVKTNQVRVRYPEGVSSVSDSRITVAGTSRRSEISGTVTVRRVAITPKADAAAILERSAAPLITPSANTGLLSNMNLDVQIETASDVAFETSVAERIEADANLRLRGTVANPALLGRINVTQGELVFFGNKYTINQGSVSFFNPVRIEPILNVDLETKARGVDVILTVTGPINKLNVSYRSDPPLQFGDIVALLATGRTPNDPTLALRATGESQSFQQLGASELLGQALQNPVGGRLQRFFGVSKIKIDPQLTGVTGSPEARLTIEQQVTPDILFTYISDVSSTSTQMVRVEYAMNRRWSAILTREENGYVAVDFAFKKHFH